MRRGNAFGLGIPTTAAAVLALVLGACAGPQDEAALLQEVFDADRAFNQAVARHDTAAFRERVDLGAVFFGSTVLRGRDAVTEGWSGIVSGAVDLSWDPQEGGVSEDLGYTIGRATFRIPDQEGNVEVSTSRYVTIWRKGDDGVWRAVVDIGTPREPVEPGTGGGP